MFPNGILSQTICLLRASAAKRNAKLHGNMAAWMLITCLQFYDNTCVRGIRAGCPRAGRRPSTCTGSAPVRAHPTMASGLVSELHRRKELGYLIILWSFVPNAECYKMFVWRRVNLNMYVWLDDKRQESEKLQLTILDSSNEMQSYNGNSATNLDLDNVQAIVKTPCCLNSMDLETFL